MSVFYEEIVLIVYYWIDCLFSFMMMCDQVLCFFNGYFMMIGFKGDNGKLLLCVYSIVSVNYEENFEFFSIKVLDGLLILKLQYIKLGDKIIVGCKFIGMLLIDYLLLGKYFYLLGSGMGLVLFISIVCDFVIYECFEKVIIVYGVCEVVELVYYDYFMVDLYQYEFFGEFVSE